MLQRTILQNEPLAVVQVKCGCCLDGWVEYSCLFYHKPLKNTSACD